MAGRCELCGEEKLCEKCGGTLQRIMKIKPDENLNKIVSAVISGTLDGLKLSDKYAALLSGFPIDTEKGGE